MRANALRLSAVLACLAALLPEAAQAQSAASDWLKGNSSRVRLIAAQIQPGVLLAGIQIDLEPGWKTYWRSPGDAGGVPPELDWKKSINLGAPELLFPAPSRLRDRDGDSVGYKHAVILPVRIVPLSPAQPIVLDLNILFGVCKNICIPEERHLTLTLEPKGETDGTIAELLSRALASVPVDMASDPKAPQLEAIKVDTGTPKPALVFDTRFPSGGDGADLFVEAVDGSFVPMTEHLTDTGDGHVGFKIDLGKSDDLKSPKGKALRLTLVSSAGAAQIIRTVP